MEEEQKKIEIIPEDIDVEDKNSYTICIKFKYHNGNPHYTIYDDIPDYEAPIEKERDDAWKDLRPEDPAMKKRPTKQDLEIYHMTRAIGEVVEEIIKPDKPGLGEHVSEQLMDTLYGK